MGGALAPFDGLTKMTDLFPAEMPHSYSFTYEAKTPNAAGSCWKPEEHTALSVYSRHLVAPGDWIER